MINALNESESKMSLPLKSATGDAAPLENGELALTWKIAWLIILTAFAGMLQWTWGGWPDPTVDFGTQLYVPWRITEGDALYRDLAYFKGPFSPYLNASLFTLLGVSLRSLVLSNLAVLLATLILLWKLLIAFTDAFSAMVCLLVVIFIFAFVQLWYLGNYNWVTPYAHEYTHGIALSLGALLATQSFARSGQMRYAAVAGALTGLVFLTTAEVFSACVSATVVGMIIALRQRATSRRVSIKIAAAFAACVFAVPLLAWIILSLAMTPSEALRGALGSWVWVFDTRIAELGFYRASIGLDDPAQRVWRLLTIFGAELAFFAVALGVAWSIPHLHWRVPARIATIVIAVTLGATFGWVLRRLVPWFEMALPLPVVVLIVGIYSARKIRRDTDGRDAARLTFAIYAGILLAKIALFARVQHYGFTLALPATMLSVVLLVGTIPRWIESRGRAGKTFRAIALAALAAYVVGVLYGHHLFTHDKTIHVASGADDFRADARGGQVNAALQLLGQRVQKSDTLAVLPQGLMVNYLARLPHPNRYLNFMPPEVISAGEEAIIRAYEARPPDWIIVARVNVRGDAFYLLDGDYAYGRELLRWVKDRYEVVAVVPGPANDPSAEWLVMRPAPLPEKGRGNGRHSD